jgi:hypothetical protein
VITHVVLMKFKDENKQENLRESRARLLAMLGPVESLRSIEVGLNVPAGERAQDLCLTTRFDDWEGLASYADHPVHVAVKTFLRGVMQTSYVVDYDTDAG